jgi:hypothetical protein
VDADGTQESAWLQNLNKKLKTDEVLGRTQCSVC